MTCIPLKIYFITTNEGKVKRMQVVTKILQHQKNEALKYREQSFKRDTIPLLEFLEDPQYTESLLINKEVIFKEMHFLFFMTIS